MHFKMAILPKKGILAISGKWGSGPQLGYPTFDQVVTFDFAFFQTFFRFWVQFGVCQKHLVLFGVFDISRNPGTF